MRKMLCYPWQFRVERLRQEAAEAGDQLMVAFCDAALAGNKGALKVCDRAIAEAAAQQPEARP